VPATPVAFSFLCVGLPTGLAFCSSDFDSLSDRLQSLLSVRIPHSLVDTELSFCLACHNPTPASLANTNPHREREQ
jgi:hypothetical protein